MARVVNPALRGSGVRGTTGLLEVPTYLSFSQLTKLSSRYRNACPRAWAYNKLMGLPGGVGNGMILGRSLDNAVTSFFQRRILGDTFDSAYESALREVSAAINADGNGFEDNAKRERSEYVEMMERALATFADVYRDHIPASLQHDHVYEVRTEGFGNVRMVGYSDWIDADGVINDLKWSGAAKWDADGVWYDDYLAQVRDQICTYYMGRVYAERMGVLDATAPVVPRGRVVVVTGKVNSKTIAVKAHDFEFTDELVKEIADAVREAVEIAHADRHPARPGDMCSYCPYLERCRSDSARYTVQTAALAIPLAVK